MGANRKADDAISGVFKLTGENKNAFLDYKNSLNKVGQTNNEKVMNKIITAWRISIPAVMRGGEKP